MESIINLLHTSPTLYDMINSLVIVILLFAVSGLHYRSIKDRKALAEILDKKQKETAL